MADTYIDYFEVSEYGNHFVTQVATLIGASPLVDMTALQTRVKDSIAAVQRELENAGVTRTGVRSGSGDANELSTRLREVVERFYYHLRSLPSSTKFDFDAFFAKRNLGNLSQLKPADMLARAATVLRGFASNTTLAGIAQWKTELSTAHQVLAATLDGKGGANSHSVKATSALQAAREDFLKVYNRIAKRLVKSTLIDLGREREFRLFFLDLQVNEGTRSTTTDAGTDTGADTGAGTDTDTDTGMGAGADTNTDA